MDVATHTVTSADIFLMGKGDWNLSYEKLGAHLCTSDGTEGCHFAVWVPDVASVSVVGDFNGWSTSANPLTRTRTGDIWEGFVPGVKEGECYKYLITTYDGQLLYKADPYAFWAQRPPETASRIYELGGYEWGDAKWMAERNATPHMKRPLNIYEVHLGSWARHDDGLTGNGDEPAPDEAAGGSYLTYDEYAEKLVPYVKEMGYSHVELMPVMEFPFDGSWGYQPTGYYAPTSRFGTPKQFMHLVDAFHQAGIGVILDWVPGGFASDDYGLALFNGQKLYEKEVHPTWGTLKFALGRGEIRNFLISNALYWLGMYHADGLRVDGVSSILYLNFGVDDPRLKKFNKNGGEQDYDAIEFLQMTNKAISKYYPSAMSIAEESTAWPLVTYPPDQGGLGFHYKWDLGWMNDTLHYMQSDFPYRPGVHRLLTFSMMYTFNENFVLPLSHDEVVHGKCSLIQRMPGDYWRQFAGLRSLAFYQIAHPGAKLNFMGNEIAQFIEWRYYESIQWFMADEYEAHGKHREYIKALNHFYLEQPALWQRSYEWDGFDWIDANNGAQSIISFVRHGDDPDDDLVILINFDVATYEEFRVGLPREGTYVEVFNSDRPEYGGSGVLNTEKLASEEVAWNGRNDSLVLRLPALAGVVLKRVGPSPATKKKEAAKKRAAAKKAAAKKPAAKKPAAKKPATKKPAPAAKSEATKKTTTAKKTTSAKSTTPKKAATAKTATTKTTAAKKPAATKTTASGASPKKPAASKTATSATKKTTAAKKPATRGESKQKLTSDKKEATKEDTGRSKK